jgi:hypothetical protein
MADCLHWGDPSVLPLLLRGRHNPDPRVAALAAQGLVAFRGRRPLQRGLQGGIVRPQALSLPRNVARTL